MSCRKCRNKSDSLRWMKQAELCCNKYRNMCCGQERGNMGQFVSANFYKNTQIFLIPQADRKHKTWFLQHWLTTQIPYDTDTSSRGTCKRVYIYLCATKDTNGYICLTYSGLKTELTEALIQLDKCKILRPGVQIPGVISGSWRVSRRMTIVFGCRRCCVII